MSAMGLVTTLASAIKQANLSLDFANQQYYVNGVKKSFSDIITFTRSTPATYVGSDGLLKSAAINEPRFAYDPITKAAQGLLIEEARTNSLSGSEQYPVTQWANAGPGTTPVVIIQNAADGIRGPLTMTRLYRADSGARYLSRSINGIGTGNTITLTFYAKAGSTNFVSCRMQATYPARADAVFNLATGTVVRSQVTTDVTTPVSSIEHVGNGVYRCRLTATGGATGWTSCAITPTPADYVVDAGTSGPAECFIDAVQVEVGAFPTSYIPTPISFASRSSIATYLDNTGMLKTAAANVARDDAWMYDTDGTTLRKIGLLLENASSNLMLYSTRFQGWATDNCYAIPNAAIAPDGTLSATKFVATTLDPRISRHYTDTIAGKTYTQSVWVWTDAGQPTTGRLFIYGSVAAEEATSIPITLTTTPTRFTYTKTFSAGATSPSVICRVDFIDGTIAVGNYAYVWGCQLEAGSIATSYIPSTDTFTSRSSPATYIGSDGLIKTAATNVARSDTYGYDSAGVLRPQGLLLESAASNILYFTEDFTRWTKAANVIVSPGDTIAPNGNLMNMITLVGTDAHNIIQGLSAPLTIGTTYTLSLYVQAKTAPFTFQLAYYDGGVQVLGATPMMGPAGTTQRLSFTFTPSTTPAAPQIRLIGYSLGYAGAQFYMWGAQLEVGNSPTSYIPSTNSFTSRASSATYTGSDGLIKTAATNVFRNDAYGYDSTGVLRPVGGLLEASGSNLMPQSSQAGLTAAWADQNSRKVPNTAVAPDGTLTAAQLVETQAVGEHRLLVSSVSVTSGTTYTGSVWAKANTRRYVYVFFSNIATWGTDTTNSVKFDLQTGTVLAQGSAITSAKAEPGPDGWYRLSITSTALSNSAVSGLSIGMSDDATATLGRDSYTGDGRSSIFVWGGQMEVGNYATSYMPSTETWTGRTSAATYIDSTGNIVSAASGVARNNAYDYDPSGTLKPIGLVLEAGMTNAASYSERFEDAGWVEQAVAILPRAAISPDGLFAATKLTEDNTSNIHWVYRQPTGLTSGNNYTFSCYVKPAGRTFVRLVMSTDSGLTVNKDAIFNLTTGTINSGATALTAYITNAGNGWYRVAVTDVVNHTSTRAYIQTHNGSTFNYTGDGNSGLYIWGAQIEAGPVPTSYTPSFPSFTSRASIATYFDSTGILQTAAANTARTAAYWPDANGVWQNTGLLLEESRQNRALYSNDPMNAAWNQSGATKTTASEVWNGMNGCRVISQGQNWHRIRIAHNAAVSAVESVTVFYKAGTSGRLRIVCRNEVTQAESNVYLQIGNPSATTIALAAGHVALVQDVPVSNTGVRMAVVRFRPTTPANNHTFAFGPDTAVSGQDVIIFGAQVEAGEYPTSFIVSAGSLVTRSSDVFTVGTTGSRAADTYTSSNGARSADVYTNTAGSRSADVSNSVVGVRAADVTSSPTVTRWSDIAKVTNLNPWFNATEGTLSASGSIPYLGGAGFPGFAGFSPVGSGAARCGFYVSDQTNDSMVFLIRNSAGAAQTAFTGPTYAAGTTVRMSGTYKLNDSAASYNGGTTMTDTAVTPATDIVELRLGKYDDAHPLNGTLSNFNYYNYRTPDAVMPLLSK